MNEKRQQAAKKARKRNQPPPAPPQKDAWLNEVEVPPLTGNEIRALHEAVEFVAAKASLGKWGLWKDAATADSKLFHALPAEARAIMLKEVEAGA